jgi:galactan endo-1,6-beta-galactosidase
LTHAKPKEDSTLRRRTAIATLLSIPLTVLAGITPAHANYTATLTRAADLTWKGWGCSLAWWGKGLGNKANANLYADILFGDGGTVNYNNSSVQLPGLKMNVVRYNIGGGGPGNTLHNNTPSFKDIEGYWPGEWGQWQPTHSSWDWFKDSAQRNMMWKARDRGATVIQFFSNSPMWWMTNSKSTNGAANRGENLDSTYYSWFTNYLTQVVKYANANWGITVHSIEALNEPSAYWWNIADGCSQEGCTFNADSQSALLTRLRSDLNGNGLSGVKIAASDENDPGTAKNTWNRLGQLGTQGNVGLVTTHSYYGLEPYRDNAGRQALRSAIGSKELWCTEYGDNDGSGQALCTTITTDINYLRPTVWCYWQPIEPYSSWGFLNANYDTGATTWVYTKYYLFATFTRYIRPGMLIQRSSDHNTVFAYDNGSAKRLTIVTVNYGTAQDITHDLSAYTSVGASYTKIETSFDGAKKLLPSGPFNLTTTERSQRRFTIAALANTVTVLQISAQ